MLSNNIVLHEERNCELPHRQLRKSRKRGPASSTSELPHRQLRKKASYSNEFRGSELPHRQLRNTYTHETGKLTQVNCRTGSLETVELAGVVIDPVNCRTGSLEI